MIKNKFPRLDITSLSDSDDDRDVLSVLHAIFEHIEKGNNIIYWTTMPQASLPESVFNEEYIETWNDIKFHCCKNNGFNWDVTIEPLTQQSPRELLNELVSSNGATDYAYCVGGLISDLLERNFDFLWFPGICGISNTHEINKSLKFWFNSIAPQYSHVTFMYKPFAEKTELEIELDQALVDVEKGNVKSYDHPISDDDNELKKEFEQLFYKWRNGEIKLDDDE